MLPSKSAAIEKEKESNQVFLASWKFDTVFFVSNTNSDAVDCSNNLNINIIKSRKMERTMNSNNTCRLAKISDYAFSPSHNSLSANQKSKPHTRAATGTVSFTQGN